MICDELDLEAVGLAVVDDVAAVVVGVVVDKPRFRSYDDDLFDLLLESLSVRRDSLARSGLPSFL